MENKKFNALNSNHNEAIFTFKKNIQPDNNTEEFFKNKFETLKFNFNLDAIEDNKMGSATSFKLDNNFNSAVLKKDSQYKIEGKLSQFFGNLNQNQGEFLHTTSSKFKLKKLTTEHLKSNSVLSKFRNEIELNKKLINDQIEKTTALKIKHNEINKRVRKEERTQRELIEKMRIEQEKASEDKKLNKNNNNETINTKNNDNNLDLNLILQNDVKFFSNTTLNSNKNSNNNSILFNINNSEIKQNDKNKISLNPSQSVKSIIFHTGIEINNGNINNIEKSNKSINRILPLESKDSITRRRQTTILINENKKSEQMLNKTSLDNNKEIEKKFRSSATVLRSKIDNKNIMSLSSEKFDKFNMTNFTKKSTINKNKNGDQQKEPNNIEEIIATLNNYTRRKTYTVQFIPNWTEKMGLPSQNFSKNFYNNVESQSSLIRDELKVILDSFQFYKTHFLSSPEIMDIFRHLDLKLQVKYNKLLEETCGILLEVPTFLLLDFSQYLEKFVAIKPPAPDRIKSKEVKDEEQNFIFNCRLLTDVSVFVKSCFEVYSILINQVDDMIIQHKNFLKLMQFLTRIRYNISSLIMTTKNANKNIKFDEKNLIKHFHGGTFGVVGNQDELLTETDIKSTKRKSGLPKINPKKPYTEKLDIIDKIKRQFIYKINEENQKIRRINQILYIPDDKEKEETEADKKKRLSRKKPHVSTLNSHVMTKLLKYCPKSIKETILSERIIERFKKKSDGKENLSYE